jgi:16S rRNA (adenine1518-N6/adenine1519-N6)-dimethyltransferase
MMDRKRQGSSRRLPTRAVPAHPRRSLGQHFLVDSQVLERIAAEAELTAGDHVLEVGAGTGQLTDALVATGARVAAVELDEDLCHALRARFLSEERIRVVCASVLQHPPEELLAEAGLAPPYVVVANIPYYITAPILRIMLEAHTPPRRLVLTVQEEVAESIVAAPGSMSLLAVSVQFYATAALLFRIPRSSFRPPPRVDSAVVRIDVAARPRLAVDDRDAFFNLVRAGFRSPRKQLHNTLSQGLWLPPGEAPALLLEAGIDQTRRPQSLSLEEWGRLYQVYAHHRKQWRRNEVSSAQEEAKDAETSAKDTP